MTKYLLGIAMLLFSTTSAFAQKRTLTGVVKDETGQPVSGASVIIKGTTTGVSANGAGEFSISAKRGDYLEVSAANFVTSDLRVGPENTVSVSLKHGNNVMEEVVVTALGIKREKRQLATATQTIGSDEINKSGSICSANILG